MTARAGIDGSNDRLKQHAGWAAVSQFVSQAAALFSIWILSNSMGAHLYGSWVLLLACSGLAAGLLDSRVWQCIARFVPKFQSDGRCDRATAVLQTCFLLEISCGLVAAAATFLLRDRLSLISPAISPGHVTLAAMIPLTAVLTEPLRAVLRLDRQFRMLVREPLVVCSVQIVLLAFVCLTKVTLYRVGAVFVATSCLRLFVLTPAALQCLNRLQLPVWNLQHLSTLRGHFRNVGRFLLFSNLTSTSALVNRLDIILLSAFSGASTVACYDIAKKLITRVDFFFQPLHKAMFYEISEHVARKDFDTIDRLCRRWSLRIFAVACIVCVAVMLWADHLVVGLFGSEFLAAATAVRILTWQLMRQPAVWVRSYMLALDRAGTMVIVKWAGTALNITLMLLLIPRYTIIGAAVGTVVPTAVWILVAVMLARTLRRPGMQNSEPSLSTTTAARLPKAA